MLILILLGIASVGLIVWEVRDGMDNLGIFMGSIIIPLAFVIALISIPLQSQSTFVQIRGIEAVRETIERAREVETIENTALQLKILELNQELAESQYYNSTIWGFWIPDEIDDVEPIK